MATVVSLHLYPVKSCAGLELDDAILGSAGLETQGVGDREWMVVTPAGDFLTQRQHPRMALIAPRVEPGALLLTAPRMEPLRLPLGEFALRSPALEVRVWNHACRAFDEGDAAAAWLSAFLGATARLARFDPAYRRASNLITTGGVTALNRFSDGYPLLLISQASLDHLNERLLEAGREALPMNRFRPNIVIDGVEAHDEDHLALLRAGDIELKPVKPCPRCPIPSIDQASGERGPDPLDILMRYRSRDEGVVFGQNAIVIHGQGNRLARGDAVHTEWDF